jgi:superfamily II DNA or RNA helicase
MQNCAIESIKKAGDKATVCAATGTGKTFISLKWLYSLKERNKVKRQDEVWFLAETKVREKTLHEEVEKFNSLYGVNVFKDFNIIFYCYQAIPTGKPTVIIADEIHDSLTPKYQKVYDNPFQYILGLSATIPKNLKVYRDDEDNELTKGELLDSIAPICFEFTLQAGIDTGILSPFETIIIDHLLDDTDLTTGLKGGSKKSGYFPVTEKNYYEYRAKQVRRPINSNYKGRLIKEACRLLWNLPSKSKSAKKIVEEGAKTILFSTQLDLLRRIIPEENIVEGGKSDKENDKIIDDFNNGKISVIGSAKKLKQGITLQGVENAIILSYYKEAYHTIQQLGRIVRFAENKIGKLYIYRTLYTFEEKWFEHIDKIKNEQNVVTDVINLNIVDIKNSKTFLL